MKIRSLSLASLLLLGVVGACTSTTDTTEYKLSFYPEYEGLKVFKAICLDTEYNTEAIARAAAKYNIKNFTKKQVRGMFSTSEYSQGENPDRTIIVEYNHRTCEVKYTVSKDIPFNIIDMQLGKVLRNKYTTVQEYYHEYKGVDYTNYLKIIGWVKHYFSVRPEGDYYVYATGK